MVRIVPSPDWFVGVDSLDLCDGGRWREQVVEDLHPYDAGTDSGFTFSSPKFATVPQDTVTEVRGWQLSGRPPPGRTVRGRGWPFLTHLRAGPLLQITASSPSHPANSFYYPRLKSLPPIATVTLARLPRSPRAFPPAPGLGGGGNEVADSLPGEPGSHPSVAPTATPQPRFTCGLLGCRRSGWRAAATFTTGCRSSTWVWGSVGTCSDITWP